MGWLDALFGRTRLIRPKTDELFALVTAQVDMEVDLGWRPAGQAALCLKPMQTTGFAEAAKELEELVQLAAGDSGTETKTFVDDFNYRWLIFSDPDFEDLVGVIHIAAKELQAKGFGEQLLAACYPFVDQEGRKAGYLIYSYKRGSFYPFIPTKDRQRDNAGEMRTATLLERRLPMEKDYARWYPLWDSPV